MRRVRGLASSPWTGRAWEKGFRRPSRRSHHDYPSRSCRGPCQHSAGPLGFKVDVSRGHRIGRVSSEWFSRPDDERYLSLPDLYAAVRARADRATTRTVESSAVRVEASRDDIERLALIVPGSAAPIAPTHWSFGQLWQPGRRTRGLSARSPGAIGWDQPAARAALPPCRTREDARGREWPNRAARRHRPRLWPDLGP